MEEAEQQVKPVDPAERAERIVEVEQRLEDEQLAAADDAEIERTVTLTPAICRSLRCVRVIDIDSDERTCDITCRVDGEERSFSVPWPDDPHDAREPLVRLCDWTGVSVDRIGNLDSVPVLTDGDAARLVVPPGVRESETTVILPTGRAVTRRHRLLRDRCRRLAAHIGFRAANTPLFSSRIESETDRPMMMGDAVFFASLFAVAIGATAAGVGLLGTPIAAAILLPVSLIASFLAHEAAISSVESFGGADLVN